MSVDYRQAFPHGGFDESAYRRFFEVASDAILVFEPEDETVLDANERACKLYGFSREELLGMSLRDLTKDVEAGMNAVEAVLRDGQLRALETVQYRKNGEPVEILVSAASLVQDGKPVILTINRDISEQKRAKRALRYREAILESVVFAAEAFLGAPSWESVIEDVLQRLGEAVNVSRVYLYENLDDAGGRPVAKGRSFWSGPDVASTFHLDRDIDYQAAGLQRWFDLLGSGELIYGSAGEFPTVEAHALSRVDVCSFALVPVFVGERWWGVIGFDDCRAERAWSEGEIEALKVAAGTLGAAIRRDLDEAALKEGEAAYRQLVEQASDVIYRADREGYFTYANPVALRILGYGEEDVIGRHYLEFVRDDYREEALEFYKTQVATGLDSTYYEFPAVRRDGSEVWFGQHVRLVRDGDEVVGVQAVARDVTERMFAEQALRESEERYRSVVTNLREVLFQTDAEGRWTFLNPAWTELTGFSIDESLERTTADFVHPDDRAYHRDAFGRMRRGEKEVCRHEIRYLTRHGGFRWTEVHARLERDDDGNITGTTGTLSDVTARHQAEAAMRALNEQLEGLVAERTAELEARETQFRILFERAPIGMAIADLDSRIIQVNPALCETFGYDEDELVGLYFSQIDPTADSVNDPEKILAFVQREGRGEAQFESQYLRKDGRRVQAEVRIVLVRDRFGKPLHYIGQIVDITERRRLEKEVLDAISKEQRRIGQDLHDGLGQHLTGVAIMTKLLGHRLHREAPDAAHEADAIEHHINDAIAHARALARGLCPVELELNGLEAALRDLAAGVRTMHGISCMLVRSNVYASLDNEVSLHLYRIAQEAVTNAMKHGEAQNVTLAVDQVDHRLVMTIEDDGKGMPEDLTQSGGMGLHTMRYRANLIGASFVITGSERRGTTVKCMLPLVGLPDEGPANDASLVAPQET